MRSAGAQPRRRGLAFLFLMLTCVSFALILKSIGSSLVFTAPSESDLGQPQRDAAAQGWKRANEVKEQQINRNPAQLVKHVPTPSPRTPTPTEKATQPLTTPTPQTPQPTKEASDAPWVEQSIGWKGEECFGVSVISNSTMLE